MHACMYEKNKKHGKGLKGRKWAQRWRCGLPETSTLSTAKARRVYRFASYPRDNCVF